MALANSNLNKQGAKNWMFRGISVFGMRYLFPPFLHLAESSGAVATGFPKKPTDFHKMLRENFSILGKSKNGKS